MENAPITGLAISGPTRTAMVELCVSIAESEMCLTPTSEELTWMRQGVRVNRKWIRVGVENQAAANRCRRVTWGWDAREVWKPSPFLLEWVPGRDSTKPAQQKDKL